jgi:elongation factor Tu
MKDDEPHGFEGEIYFLSADEGGRHTPVVSGYRPQWDFGRFPKEDSLPTYDMGEMSLIDLEQVNPGESCRVRVRIISLDEFSKKALVPGLNFKILEGSRVVGRGTIEQLI